jgi:hypothetical protein
MLVQFQRIVNYTFAVSGGFFYCICRGVNPGVLIRLNPLGGICTFSKYEIQNYLNTKSLFPKTIKLQGSVNNKLQQLQNHFGKKTIVLKPDQGLQSIGFRILHFNQRKRFLKKVEKYEFIAQELVKKPIEVGIFIVRRKKLEVVGLAVLDSASMQYKISERHDENYFSREDLITPKLNNFINKIFPKEFNYGRIDARVTSEQDIANAKNITFLEVNTGPDASPLHVLDKKYSNWQRIRMHYKLLVEAVNIAKKKKGKTVKFIAYCRYLAQEQKQLSKLKKELKRKNI